MKETYTLIGTDMSWSLAVSFVAATLIGCAIKFMKKKRPILPVSEIALAAWLVLCVILSLPLEWAIGGMMFGYGIAIFFAKTPVQPYQRWILGAVSQATACALVWSPFWMRHETIVLTDAAATYTSDVRAGNVPRSGLRIDAIINRRTWWMSKGWGSWTSYSADDKLGPSLAGFDIYWGPHGYIRGDDVGRRLANWAGTQPTIRPHTD